MDMDQNEAQNLENEALEDDDNDVIVIRKSFLVTGIVGIVSLFLGVVIGYAAFSFAYNRGADDQLAMGGGAAAGNNVVPQVAQPTQPPARIDNVSVDDDPSMGPEDAAITIVEFSDFQCPYCARFRAQTFDALVDEYGDDVRIVYRDYPLENLHPDAQRAAQAAQCAHEQGKFWEMHDIMFALGSINGLNMTALTGMADNIGLDTEQFNECVESGKYAEEVANDMADAQAYGVTGTPTFFINGVRLVGAVPLEQFKAIIDQELQN